MLNILGNGIYTLGNIIYEYFNFTFFSQKVFFPKVIQIVG